MSVILTCVSALKAQSDTCFQTNISSRLVYKNDRIVYDLNSITQGTRLKYKVDTPSDAAKLQPTFGQLFEGKSIDNIKSCSEFAKIDRHEYAYLCDSTKLVFVNLSTVSADLESQKTVDLGKENTCTSLTKSTKRGLVYVVCYSTNIANHTMVILVVNSKNFEIEKNLQIEQGKEGYLSIKLKIETVTLGDHKDTYNTKIYVYEDFKITNKFSIGVAEHTAKGELKSLGFYSLDNKNIVGLSSTDLFYTLKVDHQNVLIFVKDGSDTSNYVQFCPSNKTTAASIVCSPKQSIPFLEVNPAIAVHKYEDQEIIDLVFIVLANKTDVQIFTYDPTEESIDPLSGQKISLKSSQLYRAASTYMYNTEVYVLGYTESGQNIVIKWDFEYMTWEEFLLPDQKIQLAHVRRGTYDTDIDHYIGLEGPQFKFLPISKPLLVLQPYMIQDSQATSMNVKITCESASHKTATQTVVLNFQSKLNGNASFVVPSEIIAYSGSSRIQVPVAVEDFRGNAPTFKVEVDGQKSMPYTVKYQRVLNNLNLMNQSIVDIQDVYYIGEGIYLIESKLALTSVGCSSLNDTDFGCVVEWTQSKAGKTVLDAKMIGQVMLVLLSDIETQETKEKREVTLLVTKYLGEDKYSTSIVMKGYSSAVGAIKQVGDTVYCVIAGDSYTGSVPAINDLFMAVYSLSSKSIEPAYQLMALKGELCVQEIKFARDHAGVLYVASCCGDADTSQIYEIRLLVVARDAKEVLTGSVQRQFSEIQSKVYEMCPTGGVLNVVSFDDAVIWAYDENGSEFTRFAFPIREYGIEKVIDFYCDTEKKLFQVVGTNKDGGNPVLITYRAETQYEPARRVHSVVKLSKTPAIICSSFKQQTNEIDTLLFSSTMDDAILHQIYLGAPWIELNGEQLKNGEYVVTLTAEYPDSEGKLETVNQKSNLKVKDQEIKVSITPTQSQQIDLPASGTITLDEYLTYSGPVVRFDMPENPSAQLLDRLYPSDQFRKLKGIYDKITVDQDFVLAYAKNTISLFKNGELVEEVASKRNVLALKSLGDLQGFVALSKEQGAANYDLLLIFNLKDTWKTYIHQLKSPDIKNLVVMKSAKGSIFYSCLDGKDQSIRSGLLNIVDDKLKQIGTEDRIVNQNTVMDFDGVKLNQNDITDYVVIVSIEDQSKNSKLTLYKLDEDTFTRIGIQVGQLVDNSGVHQTVDITCNVYNASKSQFDCFLAGQNMFSHNVMFEVDFKKAETEDPENFAIVLFTNNVKNIANFAPVRSTIMGKYAAVVAKNKKVDETKKDSIYSEAYLLLIYNMEVQLDPYKILDYRELGLSKNEDLINLEPVFFTSGSDKKLKLAVNVATEDVSVRVFNLDDLKLVIAERNNLHLDITFTALQIDGERSIFKLSDVFVLPQPPKPTPSEKKLSIWLYIGIIALVLLLGGGIGVFFYLKKQNEVEGVYTAEDQLRDGFDSEHTIKNDNSLAMPS